MRVSSIIAFIVGSLFVNFYYGFFVIFVLILKILKKYNLSLILYLLYLLSIGYFVNFCSIYESWRVLFFVAIPSIVVLGDVLKDEVTYKKSDIILALLFLLSYLNEYLFMTLILGKLFVSLHGEIDLRGFLVYFLFLGVGFLIFVDKYNLLKGDYLNQVIILIGIGFLSFFGFVLEKNGKS
ncbi:hypothetical protein [Methanotorris formicicus]|uniref:Uncharacterized protein n=1 Tax=Methanotorris formicicus Mc-S-70 TaxID=647171 RepID=H1KXE6_9EURY|nr:hypothetical protein [Methanotorris formicicus]EHP88358.1 hypothetical protein MetfoDRAFT_0469 [Methanotorris formicicus Mc-S-70]